MSEQGMYPRVGSRWLGLVALVLVSPPVLAQPAEPAPPSPPALTAEQRQRLQERDRYAAEAGKLWAAGKQSEAVAAWEKKLGIERAVWGDLHDNVFDSLQQLAQWQKDREDFPAARKVLQEVLTLRARRHGERDWRVTDARLALENLEHLTQLDAAGRQQLQHAEFLSSQVLSLYQQGRFHQALPLAEQTTAIRRQVLGEQHSSYVVSVYNLAMLYQTVGDYPKARTFHEQARDLRKKLLTEDHPHYADSLLSLTLLYRDMGDYPQALALGEEARNLYKKLLTKHHPSYALCLRNLASVYQALGDYARALALGEEARDLFKKLLTEHHPRYADSLNDLGLLYKAMGNYAKALTLYEQAHDLYKKLPSENLRYASSLHNLAALYQAMGDYPKALALHEQARDLVKRVLGENHPHYATSLNNLAAVYWAMGDYAKALAVHEQARDLRKRVLGENHPHYADSLNNLALLYQAMGDYPKALALHEQARDLVKRVLGENHPSYALSLYNLAAVYLDMGDHLKALALHEQARDLYQKLLGEKHPSYALNLQNLAMVYQAMGKTREAAQLSYQALRVRQAFLDTTFTVQSDRQRLDLLDQLKVSLHVYLSVATDPDAPAARLYEPVLAWKGALAARQAEELLARDQPDLQPLVQQLRLARAGLAHLARTTPAPAQQADWLKRFDDLENRKEDLESRLARASAAYRRARQPRQARAREVAQALPPRTALIDFLKYTHYTPPPEHPGPFRREGRLLAFVLVRDREPVWVPLGPAGSIDQTVQAWRRAVAEGQDPGPAADNLRRRVWQPLGKHLTDVDTVLIAPDGPVCLLPFAALPGRQPGSYLIEEVAIGYVPSGRHLLERSAAADRPVGNRLLAVGNLAYGASAAPAPPGAQQAEWRPLPGTRPEVEGVAQRFRRAFPRGPAPRLLTGAAINAECLKRELTPAAGSPPLRYLHLATHGFFDAPPAPGAGAPRAFPGERAPRTFDRNPLLLAGLVLAEVNQTAEQGYLTAEDVAGLDLRGVELVVLSACATGLGKVSGGEGMLGLQRAFQAAGAQTLVASLWSIDDAATAVLMEEFYANLWEKRLSKLAALRQAQLTLLRNPRRVEQQRQQLREALLKRGVPEEVLAQRGIGKQAGDLPAGGRIAPRRSPPAWWAAFILSGDTR